MNKAILVITVIAVATSVAYFKASDSPLTPDATSRI